jgi:hypothetical protein
MSRVGENPYYENASEGSNMFRSSPDNKGSKTGRTPTGKKNLKPLESPRVKLGTGAKLTGEGSVRELKGFSASDSNQNSIRLYGDPNLLDEGISTELDHDVLSQVINDKVDFKFLKDVYKNMKDEINTLNEPLSSKAGIIEEEGLDLPKADLGENPCVNHPMNKIKFICRKEKIGICEICVPAHEKHILFSIDDTGKLHIIN